MLGDPVKRLAFVAKELAKRGASPQAQFGRLKDTVAWLAALLDDDELIDASRRLVTEVMRPVLGYSLSPAETDAHFGEAISNLIELLRDADLGDTPFDKFIVWIAREIPALDEVYRQTGKRQDEILRDGLIAWQAATKADVMKMSAGDVLAAITDWLALHAEETVYEFPGGWTIKKLVGPAALVREGELMHHCVKERHYAEAVAAGIKVIYSLRDPSNKPHVTMEWNPVDRRFTQMMMAWDKYPPSEEYRPMLMEFVIQVHGGTIGDGKTIKDLLLTGARADELNLRGADLPGVDLRGVDLRGANLIGANLAGAMLRGANLTDANLIRAELTQANLMNATLLEASFMDANLAGAYLTNALLNHASLRGANLSKAFLNEASLVGAGLIGANLTHAQLMRVNLSYAHLVDAKLPRAFLFEAKLPGADLTGADLSGVNLRKASLPDARLHGAVLIEAILFDAFMHGANLTSADLSGADLVGADLVGADLSNANLSGANLRTANLSSVNLAGANLSNADLTDARFSADTIMPDGTRWSPPAGLGYYRRRR